MRRETPSALVTSSRPAGRALRVHARLHAYLLVFLVMAQVTWRTSDGLVARVRLQAAHHDLSMNEYVTRVLQAATDPMFSAEPATQVRERLRLAGLLADDSPAIDAPPAGAVQGARARAGQGAELGQLVIDGR